jgi:hypothetical protein
LPSEKNSNCSIRRTIVFQSAGRKDAQEIAALADSVKGLARTVESLMTEIRKQFYSGQVRLLTGYEKLLKEQIQVINSRIRMTERLLK